MEETDTARSGKQKHEKIKRSVEEGKYVRHGRISQ